MSAEEFVALLEQSGTRVLRTDTACWYETQPHVYQSVPFHRELAPTQDELGHLFRSGAWVLRYPCAPGRGTGSYRFACTDPSYDLTTLGSTARRATRRGLERCTVRRVGFPELEPLGALELSRSTFVRQGRRVPADHDQASRCLYRAAATTDSAECWAAFVGDRLAAFMIAVAVDDCLCLPIMRSAADDLANYPNNALVYSLTREALERPEVTEVSWGLESLTPGLGGLDRFKVGMGYLQLPSAQRFEIAPWLRPAVWRPVTAGLGVLAQRGWGGARLGLVAELGHRYGAQRRSDAAS